MAGLEALWGKWWTPWRPSHAMLALSTVDRPIVEVEDQASKSTHDGVGGVVSLHQHPLTNATHLSECLCLLVCHGSFAVETILQGQVGGSGPPCASSDAEHQISDGVGVSVAAAPLDRVTVRGAHPDHALLSPELTDPKGVTHIGRPVAPVRVKLAPCCGLNCDGVGHLVFRFDAPSIRAARARLTS